MAERRMFAKRVIDSDLFLDMPLSTQALYFHLSMRADDDGFVNNPKKIVRMIGADQDSLKLLIAKNFLIPFENGLVVIRHWKIHNYIRKEVYKETEYKEEKNELSADSNGLYILRDKTATGLTQKCDNAATGLSQKCDNADTNLLLQDRLGKDRIGKVSKDKDSKHSAKRFVPPSLDEVKAYCIERNNNVDPERFIDYYQSNGWKVGKNSMKDWKAAVRSWERNQFSDKKDKNEVSEYSEVI